MDSKWLMLRRMLLWCIREDKSYATYLLNGCPKVSPATGVQSDLRLYGHTLLYADYCVGASGVPMAT